MKVFQEMIQKSMALVLTAALMMPATPLFANNQPVLTKAAESLKEAKPVEEVKLAQRVVPKVKPDESLNFLMKGSLSNQEEKNESQKKSNDGPKAENSRVQKGGEPSQGNSFSRSQNGYGPNQNLNKLDLTRLPEEPTHIRQIGPQGDNSSVSLLGTKWSVRMNYDTTVGGWTAGGVSFDDFTTQDVETYNMSQYEEIVFALRGDLTEVKFEITDIHGAKSSVIVTGINSEENQFWSIPKSAFDGLDFSAIESLLYVVEGPQMGQLDIHYGVHKNIKSLQPVLDPIAPTVPGDLPISWSVIDEAIIYQVQVSTDPTFQTNVQEHFPTGTNVTATTGAPGFYYVRVRGADTIPIENGNTTRWSEVVRADVYDQDGWIPAPSNPSRFAFRLEQIPGTDPEDGYYYIHLLDRESGKEKVIMKSENPFILDVNPEGTHAVVTWNRDNGHRSWLKGSTGLSVYNIKSGITKDLNIPGYRIDSLTFHDYPILRISVRNRKGKRAEYKVDYTIPAIA